MIEFQTAEAEIILDSISEEGKRITTFKLKYWRPIHSEVMTHRVFSRNAGSSRARPLKRVLEDMSSKPWGPCHWGKNQPGMQAFTEVDDVEQVKKLWLELQGIVSEYALKFEELKLHKQVLNRLIEPFSPIEVVLTATEFENFWNLRLHEDAQPEIYLLAKKMYDAYKQSKPTLLKKGEWHLPFVMDSDWANHHNGLVSLEDIKMISVSRCARVSYKLFNGEESNLEKDLELFSKLMGSEPFHASPTEHQATPDYINEQGEWKNKNLHGNFDGWIQFRKIFEEDYPTR